LSNGSITPQSEVPFHPFLQSDPASRSFPLFKMRMAANHPQSVYNRIPYFQIKKAMQSITAAVQTNAPSE
jgi:hypothetical protein